MHTFGIPHPPGTPLFVLLLRAWSLAFGWLGTAVACNLFSAVCTAAAGGLAASLVARATRSTALGAAAGIGAGCMSSVWLNATETEVYAVSMLCAWLALASAERAGRTGERRWLRLTAFLFGLGATLHASALVAAPAAIALAALAPARDAAAPWWRGLRIADAALLGGAFVIAAGVATGSAALALAGVLALAGAGIAGVVRRAPDGWRAAWPVLGAVALGATVVSVLVLRARHDPAINQANPATLQALLDVLGRRQYEVPGLWPRRAPLWIQLANLAQYADWQIALGVEPAAAFRPAALLRMAFTLAWLGLGALGASAHRRLDRRTWTALLVLLVSATLGVVLYLNLRAGPSIGIGILPDDAPHEPRERDYFFALGFWCWGMWAGLGAVVLTRRVLGGIGALAPRPAAAAGVALAALPVALNWRAVSRRAEPEASLPRISGLALLRATPERGVLFVYGDNDTYPLWYLQQAEDVRRDVTVVTIPLLPARWYREELARRAGLDAGPVSWEGLSRTLSRLGRSAREAGRPVAVATGVTAAERRPLGRRWRLTGLVYEPVEGEPGVVVDTAVARETSAWLGANLPAGRPREGTDPTAEIVARLLGCAGFAAEAGPAGDRRPAADSLDSICNRR